MGEPKPSEILRPFFDKAGWLLPGSGPQAHDKLLFILDRHDAELRRIAAKVDAAPPASEWPKWRNGGNGVYRWSSPTEGQYFCVNGNVTSDMNDADQAGLRNDRYPAITHAEAIALIPKIADTYPLPAKPDPTTEAPKLAELADDTQFSAENVASRMAKTLEQFEGFNIQRWLKEELTAFAARAIERHSQSSSQIIRELRQKLAIAGVEGSPPSGQDTTIGMLTERARKAESDLANARAECERLRTLIRDFTESMTKTLNDGLPKGAVR